MLEEIKEGKISLTVLSYIKTSSLLLQMDADILHYKTEKQEQELHVGMDAPATSGDSVVGGSVVAIATKLPHIRVGI